ncbi:putative 14-3-3 protein [Arabidopsis thaliana]|uniref:14-3-3 domain-containing protein n=4 Tax=Arabidopsis TaxID=3701 RepID=A0A654F3A4_ARATH|nr:14-3-3 family protein [Arabidopsis thaliana]KAG7636058.1 14-3-3 domain superfamily [Arabidopsis thaliana x Arabidopsis arenosa]KAG7640702.1 14-3-3 domain superfamily [Arabidopsis suecica]AAD28654.1 14-3-3 protein (grf15), putative [Arabidopsis thaliana]AEC06146.1 14-3-3 family protein [Arabidopsis thaliana]CAA0359632.1 unnamed protein product [Arabidopsis thaliana]|eukprot:NP_565347.1 14-3-3 family protein [Arabidopsis thaliana]
MCCYFATRIVYGLQPEALMMLDALGDELYKDSTLIMKILRDNLTFWTSDMTDEAGDEIKEAEPKVLCKCHSCFTVLSEPKHS